MQPPFHIPIPHSHNEIVKTVKNCKTAIKFLKSLLQTTINAIYCLNLFHLGGDNFVSCVSIAKGDTFTQKCWKSVHCPQNAYIALYLKVTSGRTHYNSPISTE